MELWPSRNDARRNDASWLRTWDHAVLGTALVILAWLFYRNAMLASRVIDGTRYFLLDDDMMISMRYGRNLAEGHGLVWNAGDHVEGYTNFLWTMVMAAVHLTPVADANAAVLVKAIGFGLMAGSFHLSVRLLRSFAPHSFLAPPLMLTCMINCVDIVHWSVWGFESSLMTFLLMLFLLRLVERKQDVLCFVALSLIPLTRGDGMYIFAASAFLALALSERPRRTIVHLAIALVPLAIHIAFRRAYYGDWLPNTYYLKVFKLDDTRRRGALYARNFLLSYSILLTLAAGSAFAIGRKDRRALVFFGTVLSTLGYVCLTGGDMFGNFRFFAHVMPLIFVFAAAGVQSLSRERLPTLVLGGVLLLISVPLIRPFDRLIVLDGNGDPIEQVQVAMLMKKNARPDSSVAVITAGILPYFTRLKAIDILGKSDKHIARMTPFPGSMVGHGKLDPPYTLGKEPDLVVSCRSHPWVLGLTRDTRNTDVVLSFLASGAFQDKYRPYPINEEFLVGRTEVYTHPGSKEFAHRSWTPVSISP